MLQTFTKDDRLREQYRLHEEFIRVQRGEEARKERLKEQYHTALIELEKERKAKEAALRKNEEERKAKEEALKKNEELQRISVLSLRKAGYSNDKIAEMLTISLKKVNAIL
ncbi:MAG: hypothetical protein HQK64_10965 [Desulfamplus sp.]|nr:hypothetical protein [Desulfamplus sp.]